MLGFGVDVSPREKPMFPWPAQPLEFPIPKRA